MSTSLIEIALDIAAQYPNASSEQIITAITNSIESGSVISQAISQIIIPTQIQTKQAEFLSKRMPSKRISKDIARKRTLLLEHIDNAHLFKQLQSINLFPLEDTGLGPIIGLDGARSSLLLSVSRPDSTYHGLTQPKWPIADGTRKNSPAIPHGSPATYSELVSPESSAHNAREITFASLEYLTEVEKNNDHFLSFYDIYRIIALLILHPDDEQVLFKVDEIVRNDIKLRNRDSKTDCLDELYQGDKELPEELRLKRPKLSDAPGVTLHRIRAIILDQYERSQRDASQKFINAEITYDAYIQAENKYASYANDLAAALP
jgi:hypothetical protein